MLENFIYLNQSAGIHRLPGLCPGNIYVSSETTCYISLLKFKW